jgi:hypothetical protein
MLNGNLDEVLEEVEVLQVMLVKIYHQMLK